jgi:hypothetical protein
MTFSIMTLTIVTQHDDTKDDGLNCNTVLC